MAKGQHVEAARLVKEVLPFPYMLGLVCPKPCQEVCRRGLVEEEIAICQCHGYTGELVMEMDKAPTPFPQEPATGKRIAVVGAGAAGMSCASYAALKGHDVTGAGMRVGVVGGGFTTFDCARTSRRLGANVTVVYRRSRKEMGAHYSEVDDAEHEGIKLEFYASPVRIVDKDGRVGGIEFQRMALGEPDASGRRRPVPIDGSNFTIDCDVVTTAICQLPVLNLLL